MQTSWELFTRFGELLEQETPKITLQVAEKARDHIMDHIIANGQISADDSDGHVHMVNSITTTPQPDTSTDVTVEAPYAGYQNYGTRYLPSRPFFEPGLEDTQTDLEQALQDLVAAMERVRP